MTSGIFGQVGIKSESTYGTAVTVDTFLPVLSPSTFNVDFARVDSKAIRGGRRIASRFRTGATRVSGSLPMELHPQPLATLLTHMFGTVNTTGAGPYTHTATRGSLVGKSFTCQVGIPDSSGTVRAFTYDGCKIAGWELSCRVDEIPTLTLDVIGQSVTTATALAAASYAAVDPFVFVDGSVTINGSAVASVRDITLRGDNATNDRIRIGSAETVEPLSGGMSEYGGTATVDFDDLTLYNLYAAATEVAYVLAFSDGTNSLTITMNTRLDGSVPDLTDDMIAQDVPFTCLSSTDDATAITAVLVNSESTAA